MTLEELLISLRNFMRDNIGITVLFEHKDGYKIVETVNPEELTITFKWLTSEVYSVKHLLPAEFKNLICPVIPYCWNEYEYR